MTRLQKFLQTKAIIDMKIKAAYKDFKKFICCNELPDFTIKYVDSLADPDIKFNARILTHNTPITLEVDIAYLSSGNFNSLLVHEFTHLYDYIMLSKYYSDKELKDILKIYSEHHAEQIQILYDLCIVSNVQEYINKISLDDTIKNILEDKKNLFIVKTYNYHKKQSAETFYDMKVAYMYLSGATSLINQLTGINQDMLDFKFKQYKNQMHKIEALLKSIHYMATPSKEILDKVIKLNEETDNIFIEEFKKNVI